MALSFWICGSGSAWELWWVAAEGEQCEGDEGLGAVEPERDSCEEADLAVGGFDESLGEAVFEVAVDRFAMFREPRSRPSETGRPLGKSKEAGGS
jgi:hypothetical protein